MNEKLEALNQEIEKTEKKLRWAQQEEKRLTHQAKALTTGRNGRTGFAPEPPCWKATFPTRKPSRMNRSVYS